MVEVRGNSCFTNAERGANSFVAMLKGITNLGVVLSWVCEVLVML